MPVPFFTRGIARGHLGVRGRRATLSPLGSFFPEGEKVHIFFRPSPDFLGYLPETPIVVSERSPIPSWRGEFPFFFWIFIPPSRRHLWVFSIPPNTSVASFTLSFTWRGLFLSIPCCMMLRALANLSTFSFCSFCSWRTSFHPLAPGEASKSTFPMLSVFGSINLFTSASCVEERVRIAGNGCTLGPKSYPSFLRPNLRLSVPGIYGQTGLARSKTGSDTCVHYALPDQGPKRAGS